MRVLEQTHLHTSWVTFPLEKQKKRKNLFVFQLHFDESLEMPKQMGFFSFFHEKRDILETF